MPNRSLMLRLEAMLFTRQEAVSLDVLAKALDVSLEETALALVALQQAYETRAMEVVNVASGWRFQLRAQYQADVQALTETQPTRYSRAFWETLAFIAYHQPVTRAQIDHVRGVTTSASVYRQLFDLEWIAVVGQKETVGRPDLLATTKRFLDDFTLKSLKDLPPLAHPEHTAPSETLSDLFAPTSE